MTDHHPRFIEPKLLQALGNSPAALLHGPRQCGKTTLVRRLLEPLGYGHVDCDDPAIREQAKQDPTGMVARLPERVILDEAQNVPGIFGALKVEIDRRRTNGRFLLTSSCDILRVPRLTNSLAGRVLFLRMHPLSQGEMRREKPIFLDALFGDGFRFARRERLGGSLDEMIARGGYPLALAQPMFREHRDWHRNHLGTTVLRETEDLFRIDRPDALPGIMEQAARRTAGVLSVSAIANPLDVTVPTARRYLRLLEHMLLLECLPPWRRTRVPRQVKAPKLHIGDTGMACALLNVNGQVVGEDRQLHGRLLKTFVYQELRRQASWHEAHFDFCHFRHMDRAEVDIVLEGEGRAVAGVAVKAGATVRPSDFRGLRMLAEAAGKHFVGGVVLYDGEVSIGHRERFHVLPLSLLWDVTVE